LIGYSDVNWGDDLNEFRSTTSYVFTLGEGAISWCSKKQHCIAMSTKEIEYVVYSTVMQETMCLRSFLQDLNLTPVVNDPIKMLCHNTIAIQFAKDLKFHWKVKHNKRCYPFT